MFKKINQAIKFYNEYALINNLETIDINDIKEEEKLRKKELFDKIMASNPQVSSKTIQDKSTAIEKENTVRCPKCGSTQLTANKKGYSLGKAVAGGVLTLTPIVGVATGLIGKNKIIITCLSCGKQFKPGAK